MKWLLYLLLLLLGGNFFLLIEDLPNNVPKHLAIEMDWKSLHSSQVVFTFRNPDTLISHEMYLLKNEYNLPILYYADIQTPVCIDGLCKPLYIELYWDLTGQYVGYGEYTEQRLSKYDHDFFEEKNYLKLHELLSNSHSILGKRKKTDLYNIQQTRTEKIKFNGKEVDGVTGATIKEVKNDIVAGALYSCYTLWHLAYGEAVARIKDQLPLIYSDSLEASFLTSNWENYQIYAVKQLPPSKFEENIKELVSILQKAKPLTRAYIFKKMPKELFGHPVMETRLYAHFSTLDFNSKTLLLKGLSYSNTSVAMELSKQVGSLSKNQLQTYLNQLKDHPALLSGSLVQQLRNLSQDSNFAYSYLLKDFLENLPK